MDPEEWTQSANDALEITLLDPKTGEPVADEFPPAYTYSVFGEAETIFGYKDLKMKLLFAADSMKPCLTVTYGEKVKKVGEVEAEDVIKTLSEYLPEDAITTTEEDFTVALTSRDTPFTPPGALHSTFTASATPYEIYRSTLADETTRDLLANFQILVPLFIEGGTLLDLDDEPWTVDRWDIFLLYTPATASSPRTFIGYCTLYRNLFFSTTTPDLARTRLSQFLILPPFQHQGLGATFYDHIIAHYLASAQTQELTVEDPSDAFMDLRDLQDFRRLTADAEFAALTIDSVYAKTAPLEQLRKKHKMPERQFKRMVELWLLKGLQRKKQKEYKKYRLIVKARIYKQNADVLAQVDAAERVDKLEETYFHLEDEYVALLKKMENRWTVEVEGEEEAGGKGKGKGKRRASALGGEEKRVRVDVEKV